MLSHLRNHHPETLTTNQQYQPTMESHIKKTNITKLPMTSPEAQKITKALLHYIMADLRPISIVSSEAFQTLLETLNPRYKVPSATYMTSEMAKEYEIQKKIVQQELLKVDRVALTTDYWTSLANEGYLSLTVHYVKDFILHGKVIIFN